MNNYTQMADDYKRIEKAIQFIEEHFTSQPTLEEISKSVHMSKYHFNRIFKRWAGISPKQFQQFITLDYTKESLIRTKNLLDSSLDAGLSGPGRLHDLFVTFEAMTPGEFKMKGAGLTITYSIQKTPFGDCLIASTQRGICHLSFIHKTNKKSSIDQLLSIWPKATYIMQDRYADTLIKHIFNLGDHPENSPFNLHLKGTNFQIQVWKALLTIPHGWLASYQDIAQYMGKPKAFRAVASAIAMNPIAYLIPCHRVISKSGKIHRYRWGSTRKKAIIGWEAGLNQQKYTHAQQAS